MSRLIFELEAGSKCARFAAIDWSRASRTTEQARLHCTLFQNVDTVWPPLQEASEKGKHAWYQYTSECGAPGECGKAQGDVVMLSKIQSKGQAAYFQQIFFSEGLSQKRLDNLRAEMQAGFIQPLGTQAKGHFVKGLPSTKQGFAAVWDQPLFDVLPCWLQELQDLQSVLQHTNHRMITIAA